jgi:septal ring factor EnvC (AmiA/AmiB activator)
MSYEKTLTEKTLTKQQIIKQKIAELRKLEKIEKDIANLKAKIEKLREQKRELEAKYGL